MNFLLIGADSFDKYLKRKHGNEHNTRWARHKHVITHLNMARDVDKLSFNNPYQRFKNTLVEGSWKPPELGEMKKLLKKYIERKDKPLPILSRKNGVHQTDIREGLTQAEVLVLRRFLFSCNCALRISDLQELERGMFCNGEMSITPNKTEKYGTKINSVPPLNDIARMMLDDEPADNPGHKVFDRYKELPTNRLLKRIAIKTSIGVNLHNHVARYTLASLMDQAGANLTGLMEYMGLKKRETLEKYVKTNNKVIAGDIAKLNAMMKETTV